MKNKSRVQTWFNLNHFSEQQMCPFDTGTELCSREAVLRVNNAYHVSINVLDCDTELYVATPSMC